MKEKCRIKCQKKIKFTIPHSKEKKSQIQQSIEQIKCLNSQCQKYYTSLQYSEESIDL